MGKKLHLEVMFPGRHFPNVQFKPRRSQQDKHVFQVECKLAGVHRVNEAIKDKRLLIGGKYRSLSMACLASNFTICVMKAINETIDKKVGPVAESTKAKDYELISLPHIHGADWHPFAWFKKNIIDPNGLKFDQWLARTINDLIKQEDAPRKEISFKRTNKQIASFASTYATTLIDRTKGDPSKVHGDPLDWRTKLNNYLAQGTYLVHNPMGKPLPPKPNTPLEPQLEHVFAPRVTLVGGGPNMMPLVYHLRKIGNELLAPCFFNKNFTIFFKCEKAFDSRKWTKWQNELFAKQENKCLIRLPISMHRNCNYHGGPLVEDYHKHEGIKVIAWTSTQPKEDTYPIDVDATGQPYHGSQPSYFEEIMQQNQQRASFEEFMQQNQYQSHMGGFAINANNDIMEDDASDHDLDFADSLENMLFNSQTIGGVDKYGSENDSDESQTRAHNVLKRKKQDMEDEMEDDDSQDDAIEEEQLEQGDSDSESLASVSKED